MDYPRCAHCRNPIKARHREVRHPFAEASFHDDCWTVVREALQDEYARRIEAQGLAAIVSPYVLRLDGDDWLAEPDAAQPPASPEEGLLTSAESLGV